ncbi:putative C-type lectin domain family 20 member A isoform X1 [Clarias magur]|uniref:Putative C-type lectin domain family 20 member A isoform X1 n=1 Tax=Clarias magur TaxID=1594786 RepID=A0A8J4TMS8_CLAMG|nr:putative C-type lectin domain family 20 member A isoform X1 [Clarias magur]
MGIPLVHSVYSKYHLVLQGKNWSDAQTYCQARYTDLAIVKSNDEMVRLQNEAQIQNFSSGAWIGLYNDINSWRWSMGNVPVGFTGWYSGLPNNGGGDNTTGNPGYVRGPSSVTWLAAQAYCRKYYTDLVSINDAKENSIVIGMTSGWTWIGLYRDGWKWIDKTTFSTISWASGKPDNALWHENCGYLNNGQAVDALCSDMMPFFCYSGVTGEQQILRVKVQSTQDVNDPAVMTAILAKIKELSDNAMAQNITVSWRARSDGKLTCWSVWIE